MATPTAATANFEHRTAPQTPDFIFRNEGTIGVLFPKTDVAEQWLTDNVGAEAQYFCGCAPSDRGLVIEHRYVQDILFGIHNDGLTFQAGVI